jgi:hypothetical protein
MIDSPGGAALLDIPVGDQQSLPFHFPEDGVDNTAGSIDLKLFFKRLINFAAVDGLNFDQLDDGNAQNTFEERFGRKIYALRRVIRRH